ncbi:MAG TPA: response regulator [Isosphaeraceae bacterium]|nr:response regulator [Isosphaeraceae bacterium]
MAEQTPATILVVDDDETKRYTISRVLRRAGFGSLEAADGAEALHLAAANPDLIVLDVNLPDIDGFEVCRRIKADPATATIPVLHLSAARVEVEDRVQGLDSGADGYLAQTVEPPELIATVRALLRIRQAEEAARQAARQWQATFDAINDGVALIDHRGSLLRCNRSLEQILGRPGTALIGRPFPEVLALGPDCPEGPLVDRMLQAHGRQTLALSLGDRWFRLTADPLHDEGGGPTATVFILTDITESRRMAEELRRRVDELAEADRRKDEFLAMLAHELRNPLAPIRNALEVIRLDANDLDAVEQAREIAGRQVGHMARLLDDLLDVSRITRGKIQLRKRWLDLNEVARNAVESSRPAIEGAGLTLTVDLPPQPLWFEGDPTRLEQVLANLLNNAAKYSEPGGDIALSAGREAGHLVLRVRDTGIGLSPEMLPRVFDLFAQADRSLVRAQGGLGIGLTLVRSLVEMHGGAITAASPGLGQGSEFTIRLPASAVIEPPRRESPSPAEAAAARPLSILVVEDHRDAALSLARVLALWGHQVYVVHSGPDAVEAVFARPTDLVLLDIGLPGMDGYQVARKLREQAGSSLMLIALTGYARDEDRRRSRRAGFDHHLVKPVALDELQGLLTRLEPLARPAADPRA